MHETALLQNLLSAAEEALAPYEVEKVERLTVKAGVLANLLPDALDFAFETLTPGTIFAAAELVVETLPIGARCLGCGAEYAAEKLPAACPRCGGEQAEVLSGTEAYLDNIEFSLKGESQ